MWENCREAPNWNTRGDPAVGPPAAGARRHRRAARQSRARRRGAQAVGRVAAPDAARGRAVVFENIEHYKQRIDDPTLDVDENCVMVLKNCGPKGYPGMAEVGNMGLPPKLLRSGITDMVRISDARMSGTAYGTVVLHVCARGRGRRAAGAGPRRRQDRTRRRDAPPASGCVATTNSRAAAPRWQRRRAADVAAATSASTSTTCCRPITGADFDFLVGCRGHVVTRESH